MAESGLLQKNLNHAKYIKGDFNMGVKGVYSKPVCKHCGETEPTNFWPKMKTTCKKCHGKDIAKHLKNTRQRAIEYKGGKCEHCGYDKYIGALEFHHKDPTQKDPLGLRKFSFEKLKEEVDKCILLCSNCHREEHGKLRLEGQADW